jgi:xanthine dehydrogenase accessory factor
MVPDPENILPQAAAWHADGRPTVIATVVETWGSSPRPCGSQMALTADGAMAGSVSGGCIEAAVVEAARMTFATGVPQLLEYAVSNDRAWEVGLACGGRLSVFLERIG